MREALAVRGATPSIGGTYSFYEGYQMKFAGKFAVASALVFASVLPAAAADLIIDTPPPPAPEAPASVSQWDGLYAGFGGSYELWSDPASDAVSVSGILGGNITAGAFLIGGEIYAAPIYYLDDEEFAVRVGAEGRVGILASDVLLYASAGIEYDSLYEGQGTVGLGVEFFVADDVSLDVNYDFVSDLDSTYTANRVSAAVKWHF